MNDSAQYVDVVDVEIGADSVSELCVHVRVENKWYWIPYSQTRQLTRNPNVIGADAIRISKWLADKLELDHE
jgi:hypothetical protein